jgi:RNA polymerase sigma-70 factor, ECF subfamily
VSILQTTVTAPEPTPTPILPFEPVPRSAERALIARVLDGDRIAARELYDAHVARVFGLAFRLCGDREQAHELVQEAFIRAFGQLRNFRGDAAFSSWLHRILVTVELNARRRNRRNERETTLESVPHLAYDRDRSVEPDLRDTLHASIDALPDIYRTTFIMHDIEGYTHVEIAEALGVAVGTCKGRLSIARAKLRAVLAPFMKE